MTAEGPASVGELILVAEVIRPHGLRGEVKITLHSDVPDRFAVGGELLLTGGGRSRQRVRIAQFRTVRGGALIRFKGISDRDQAEALRGARLEVAASDSPAAPAGMYYFHELVGCRCFDAEHGELGEVAEVIEDGGGILLLVRQGDQSLPVPFVESFLDAVDIAARRIDLRLPPGLVEACASKS